jgi:meiotically up-regulated gene 157 (Mug157) protein
VRCALLPKPQPVKLCHPQPTAQPNLSTAAVLQAGDLPQLWLRDSTASVHHLILSGAARHEPAARLAVEGLARSLAYYILRDPMCSAWEPYDNGRECRGGGTYSDFRFELDSPVYVLRFFRALRQHNLSAVLDEQPVVDATATLLDKVIAGKVHPGSGLIFSEARPSDDAIPEGYFSIPDNLFAAAELEHMRVHVVPGSPHAEQWSGLAARAHAIAARVRGGIDKFGTSATRSARTYCYEAYVPSALEWWRMMSADRIALGRVHTSEAASIGTRGGKGLGGLGRKAIVLTPEAVKMALHAVKGAKSTLGIAHHQRIRASPNGSCTMMDDANVPSLLALPYLDDGAGVLNLTVYSATRAAVLSRRNPHFFCSNHSLKPICGIGSPHTERAGSHTRIWPMSLIMRALTARSVAEVLDMLDALTRTDAGTDMMHEAFEPDDPSSFTRRWFDCESSVGSEPKAT